MRPDVLTGRGLKSGRPSRDFRLCWKRAKGPKIVREKGRLSPRKGLNCGENNGVSSAKEFSYSPKNIGFGLNPVSIVAGAMLGMAN